MKSFSLGVFSVFLAVAFAAEARQARAQEDGSSGKHVSFYSVGFTAAPEGHAYTLGYASPELIRYPTRSGASSVVKVFFDVQNVTAPNLLTENAENKKTDYTLITAGPRIAFDYSSVHGGIFEAAPTFLIDDGGLSDDADFGLRIGIGYRFLIHEDSGSDQKQYALLKMDKVFLFDEADNVSGQPDILNGAYITVGLGLTF
jgi:hypothetical protein